MQPPPNRLLPAAANCFSADHPLVKGAGTGNDSDGRVLGAGTGNETGEQATTRTGEDLELALATTRSWHWQQDGEY